jgi:DNA-binding MarR family transcriptional regulator
MATARASETSQAADEESLDGGGGGRDPVAEAVKQWRAHRLGALTHMETVTQLHRLHRVLVSRAEQELRPFKVTLAQYDTLVLLYFTRRGALPLGQMGRRLFVHPTTVTNTVDQLERKALVIRERPTSDRRQVLAALTPSGREVAREASKRMAKIRYGLAEMNDRDAQAITDAIKRFRDDIGDQISG